MAVGQVLAILEHGHLGYPSLRLPWDKAEALFVAWVAHYDLPTHRDARRLAYVVQRYTDALEWDLRVHAAGADLGALWRDRRWRYLLNLIDHLPTSHYAHAVSQDPEHAKMLAEAMVARKADSNALESPKGPPLHSWSPQMAITADLIDSVNRLHYAIWMSNGGKGVKPDDPYPRPTSLVVEATREAEYNRRQKVHKSLVARMLPHKAAEPD